MSDVLEFEADGSQAISEIEKVARAMLSQHNPAMMEGARVIVAYNEEGQRQVITIERQIDAYTKLVATARKTEDGIYSTARAIRDASDTAEEFTSWLEALTEGADKYAQVMGKAQTLGMAENLKRDAAATAEATANLADFIDAIVRSVEAEKDAAERRSEYALNGAVKTTSDLLSEQANRLEAEKLAAEKASEYALNGAVRTTSDLLSEHERRIAAEEIAQAEDLKAKIDWANAKINIAADEARRELQIEAEMEKLLKAARAELLNQERAHTRALLDNKKFEADEANRLSASQRAKERNFGAFVSSVVGSGSISFTSLGRAAAEQVSGSGLGLAGAGLASGGVSLAAHAAESLVAELNEGSKRSVEFELQIARISSISKTAADNQDAWRQKVQSLSEAFNVKPMEVAAAVYEGLSKGSIKGAASTKTLEEALKLAKVTGIDTKEAMTTLNDIMSVYGPSAGDAAANSELLFQAAKNGGLSIAELGSSLSRVTPLAQSLGISAREVVAALEVMRSKGIATGQGIAGLTQLLEELRKPSQLTKETLTQLGFASGQQAIATLGQVGAFKALNDQIKKTGHDIAEIFPNIRALRTDLILTAEGATEYTEKLKTLTTAHGGLTDAVDKVKGAPGQEWEAMLNRWGVTADNAGKKINEVKDAIARVLQGKPIDVPQVQGDRTAAQQAADAAYKKSIQDQMDREESNYGKPTGKGSLSELYMGHQQAADEAALLAGTLQSTYSKKLLEDRLKTTEALYQKDLQQLQASGLKKQELYGKELEALNKNGQGYIEELKKRVEATQQYEFKMQEGFTKGKFERSLIHAGETPSGGAMGTMTPQQKAQDDLIEKRIKVLNEQRDEKLSHYDSLQGKAFTDSKDPEEMKQLEEEILKLREKQAEVSLGLAATDRQRANIEEDLAKHQQEALDFGSQIESVNQSHVKRAEELETYRAKNTKSKDAQEKLDALRADVASGKITPGEFDKRSSEIHQLIGPGGFESKDPTGSRAKAQFALSMYGSQMAIMDPARHQQMLEAAGVDFNLTGAGISGPVSKEQQAADRAARIKRAEEQASAGEATRLANMSPEARRAEEDRLYSLGRSFSPRTKHQLLPDDRPGERPEEPKTLAGAAQAVGEGFLNLVDTLKDVGVALKEMVDGADDRATRARQSDLNDQYNQMKYGPFQAQGANIFQGFEDGGWVGGVGGPDSQHAMLSPGEHVTNPAAARTFAPLLEAINNYDGPTGGSSVTNVGDINITVKGGSSSSQTVEEIGRGLERALRRGTFRLRGN